MRVFPTKGQLLGHVILPNKLAIAKDATRRIKNAKFPEDLKQLRLFLGACNVYRRFIKSYAHIATPLNRMLTKDAKNNFANPTEDQVKSFEDLKAALCSPPILALPMRKGPYMLDTDSSAYQAGVVLLQQQDDKNPKSCATIGYWSRSLNPAERKYTASERECL